MDHPLERRLPPLTPRSAAKGKRLAARLGLAALLALAPLFFEEFARAAEPPKAEVHHEITVRLEPERFTISAADRVTFASPPAPGGVVFLLHEGLSPRTPTPGCSVAPLPKPAGAPAYGEAYRLTLPEGASTAEIVYGGVLRHEPEAVGKEYARGFSSTPGIVSPQGAVLSGASLWIPSFGEPLLTFDLTASLPAGWDAVSQGDRALRETDAGGGRRVRWLSQDPQDEAYLIAAPFTLAEEEGAGLTAQAYLRAPDPALSKRLNAATLRFAEFYGNLLGPYPFRKFAAVENFWETGFGMPSFTLLGPKVIRFPFLLRTSYPHEILHNWWGNGVLVDYASGNWAEGLTAYLADHLLAEQAGAGSDYRRETLQKYADYVSKTLDAPLSEFTSRHSSATEAVGYGKSLFLFHMLRRELGDEAFIAGLRRLYADHLRRRASWEDVRKAFEAASGKPLSPFFTLWVSRTGAPRLTLSGLSATRDAQGWKLAGTIAQDAPGDPFPLTVPLAITLEGQKQAQLKTLRIGENGERATPFVLDLPAEPLRADLDPSCDVFRLLDPNEIPPALSGAFGAPRSLIVLPAAAPPELAAAYRALAEAWRTGGEGDWEIATDEELPALPTDRSVWVFGWENRFFAAAKEALSPYPARFGEAETDLASSTVPRAGHAVVATARGPGGNANPVTLLAADTAASLPGLARKLPHYHKYSYLGFSGAEPVNVAKGRWEAQGSPLVALLKPQAQAARLPREAPLADLPPLFSPERLAATVEALSSPALDGRGAGSPGHDQAAVFVAEAFSRAGLAPGGDSGGWFQTFPVQLPLVDGEPPVATRLSNVVGKLPGTRAEFADAPVVVGAHYDGQGDGRFGGKTAERGNHHPGADDNASGVAALLELARHFAAQPLERPVLFVAFGGEEAQRLGSRHFVQTWEGTPTRKPFAAINLDTVGRLGRGKLLVLGAGSAREWISIFMGAGFVVGVNVESVTRDVGSSDQTSFLDAGIPAVQLFTGAHAEYHTPGDTPEKIDAVGLASVTAVAKEALEYLGNRAEPLTPLSGAARPSAASGGERKASLGVIPDFAYEGEGVKLAGVTPNSPAERAGLAAGDLLLEVNGSPVSDLRAFSALLKALAPGERVRLGYRRGGEKAQVDALLETR